VIPDRRRRSALAGPRRLLRGLATVVLVGLLAVACTPAATFDPLGTCVVDGRAPGAYPELEAFVPQALDGAAPTLVDSGRSCSAPALGELTDRGVREIRYAGAVWDEGSGAGTSIAIFAWPADGGSWETLPAEWIEAFYEAGAQASSKTANIETSRPTMGDAGTVWRLDTLNDLSQQTVVVRPFGSFVQVVLVATHVDPGASLAEHERRVELAVRTAAQVVLPSAG
jgi:hypothetical protein